LDTIEVDLVPEKKGLFLKHVEYQVSSKVMNIVTNLSLNQTLIVAFEEK
jgi:hypothetical protein